MTQEATIKELRAEQAQLSSDAFLQEARVAELQARLAQAEGRVKQQTAFEAELLHWCHAPPALPLLH